MSLLANYGLLNRNRTPTDMSPFVFLLGSFGQSDAIGRCVAQRLVQLTKYREIPDDILIYNKPDYSAADNGAFNVLLEGGFLTTEPSGGVSGATGAYGVLAENLKRISPNTVYIIPGGDAGTAIEQGLTTPDWSELSVAQCFDIFFERYYQVAYDKVVLIHPTKTIVPIFYWDQGVADAGDNTATANYPTNFDNMFAAMLAAHPSFVNALFIVSEVYFANTANEATISSFFQSYCAADPVHRKYIPISAFPRRMDLTAAEINGVTGAGSDVGNMHASYLMQIHKAETAYQFIKDFYAPYNDDSEILNNTAFDPATITPNGFRLQLNRGNVTVTDAYSSVGAVNNDLNIGTFAFTNGSPPAKLKILGRKGCVTWMNGGADRLQSSAPIGTALFAGGSFSVGWWGKIRDTSPSGTNTWLHDIANTASVDQSSFRVYTTSSSSFFCRLAIGGVVSLGQWGIDWETENGGSTVKKERFIALTFTQGDAMRCYVDGVLRTVDPVNNGNLAALTLTNYVNNTNVFTIGARRSGASSYADPLAATNREIIWQTGVVWSVADMQNLMLN